MSDSWTYYRIFIKPSDSGAISNYASLLQDVVYPIVTEFRSHIRHFHFFRYAGPYKDHAEEVEKQLQVAPEDWVHFIRLRILIDDGEAANLHSLLLQHCENSASCMGIETPIRAYDIEADIVARFGNTRTWQVADLIQASSELALAYAADGQPYDPHPKGQGGSAGLVHLVANTLCYQLSVVGVDWQRQWQKRIGP